MLQLYRLFWLIALVSYLTLPQLAAQTASPNRWRTGISMGTGTQQIWPLDNIHYYHKNFFIKLRLEYVLKWGKHVDVELFAHPEINLASHTSLDPPWIGDDGIDHNLLYSMYQYSLNIGGLVRKTFPNAISIYAGGSVGPLYVDLRTERLQKGFAFADVIAWGMCYRQGRIMLDLRMSLRHVSNANTSHPNKGYNSMNFELGALVDIL